MRIIPLETIAAPLLVLTVSSAAFAQKPVEQDLPPSSPRASESEANVSAPVGAVSVHGQATLIAQTQFRLRRSPYEGPASLRGRGESQTTHTYTLFGAVRVAPNLDVFVNPEVAAGRGIAAGGGLAGYSNGDLIGQQVYGDRAYLARYFLSWVVRTGRGGVVGQSVPSAENQIAERLPVPRLVVRFGKMAVTDLMDTNAYGNNPRTQFVNNAFGNNLAFDYAQETRGYSGGLFVSWVNPNVTVRAATFALPTVPGGTQLTYNPARYRGDQVEVELRPRALFAGRQNKEARGGSSDDEAEGEAPTTVLRLLGFRNVYEGGRYDDALSLAGSNAPDLSAVRRRRAVKYGFGLNLEQPLADNGETGLFARLGWNDGKTESANFAECDRFASVGVQVSGTRWRRNNDRVGIAFAQSDISAAHRNFLAAGGQGLALGDGTLRHGKERIVETYYACYIGDRTSVSTGLQHIENPGYNRDRGPGQIFSVRLHTEF